MTQSIAHGVWTAIVTPFHADGSLDLSSFSRLMERQAAAGVAGVVLSGTTGEAGTLTVQEKLTLIRRAKATVGSDVQIMAGSGAANTQQDVELSKLSVDAGADSLLVVTPAYSKPSLAGLKAHFTAIAAAATVPVCLYHVPSRTACNLAAEPLTELLAIPNIGAIKEASGDMATMTKLSGRCPDTTLLSGDDFSYLPSLLAGSHGCVSVVGNVFPKLMVQMTKAYEVGDLKMAKALNQDVVAASTALFLDSSPAPTKQILAQHGLCEDVLRAPLVPVTADKRPAVQEALEAVNRSHQELSS